MSYAERFFYPDGTFRSPELAALHAVIVQGGFSTPAIEAKRMLCDGGLGGIAARHWLDEHDVRERCAWCGGDALVGTVCPKSLACPTCGAEPGARCKRPSGHKATQLHAARIAAAENPPLGGRAADVSPGD